MKLKFWLQAARLRTLPLAFSTIITGTACAIYNDSFNVNILCLALLTTLLLQVLSNFANDYGDAISGKDNANRIGPQRMVSSGAIHPNKMKQAIVLFSFLAFFSGSALIFLALNNWKLLIAFYILGGLSIWAAIKYTMGDKPYGYSGLGDLFVFVFFGLVGVFGSYFLYTKSFNWQVLLPASAMGLLSASVLNLNNMRDIENDKKTGKNTLAVKLGINKAKIYQMFATLLPFILLGIFCLINNFKNQQYAWLITLPFFAGNLRTLVKTAEPKKLDPLLKKTALGTFVLSILFLLGIVYFNCYS